ncbi:hypothetical protein GHT06_009329 [Daphnia sinensis]|uniref:Uncharacterized protein n=1 Tax=Daphnia sinensis TaxID=1820382 RepID=A0AAD5L5W4_9CRUS|nr:hypothetical protein GHT06_009329 [Daphnia sinensis]
MPLPVCEPKHIKRKEKNGVTRKSASKGSSSQSKAPLSVSTNENSTAVSLSVNDISSHNISSYIYGSTATPESVISLLSPDVVNEEEHHITTPVEKLPSPCLLSLPSEGQLSILIDSAMFCDKDLPNVEICSETTKNQRSLLAPEVVTLEEHHTIALAEKLLYPCLLNLPPDEGQPSVLIDSEIVSADRLLNYEMCLATSETQTCLPAPEENMEERHIDLAVEKISPPCSMLYDSEMLCDDDFRNVESCSTTPESEASLLVQEVVTFGGSSKHCTSRETVIPLLVQPVNVPTVNDEDHVNSPVLVTSCCPLLLIPEERNPSTEAFFTERKPDHSDFDHFSWVVQLPVTGWIWSFFNGILICSNNAKTGKGYIYTKLVEIVTTKRVLLHMGGKQVCPKAIKCHFSTTQELELIIKDFDAMKRCQGTVISATDKKIIHLFRNGKIDQDGLFRSLHCEEFAERNFMCNRCKRINEYFCEMKNAEEGKKENLFRKSQHKKRQQQYMKNRIFNAIKKIKVISLN